MQRRWLMAAFALSGCATIPVANNIVMTTDEQYVEGRFGPCKETEMIIYPDRIEYYTDCGVKRVVKTKRFEAPEIKR